LTLKCNVGAVNNLQSSSSKFEFKHLNFSKGKLFIGLYGMLKLLRINNRQPNKANIATSTNKLSQSYVTVIFDIIVHVFILNLKSKKENKLQFTCLLFTFYIFSSPFGLRVRGACTLRANLFDAHNQQELTSFPPHTTNFKIHLKGVDNMKE
jgi:hypothetical protein